MKKFLVCLLVLFLVIGLVLCILFACKNREVEEEKPTTIVGVWKSEELSSFSSSTTSDISQRMIYAFAENGHMLAIDLYADQITRVIGAHYELSDEGILAIKQYGKDDGEMIAEFSGNTLKLSLNLETGDYEDEENLSGKSISFTREEDPDEAVILGNWIYAYADENGKTIQIQYAFTQDGKAARALYEGNDLTDALLKDYVAQTYTFQTVNGEEILYMFTETADGSQAEVELFRVGFPYNGYMTMEPLIETEGVTEVLPFVSITEEKK